MRITARPKIKKNEGRVEAHRLTAYCQLQVTTILVICSEHFLSLSRHCHVFLICVVCVMSLHCTSGIGCNSPRRQLLRLWLRMYTAVRTAAAAGIICVFLYCLVELLRYDQYPLPEWKR